MLKLKSASLLLGVIFSGCAVEPPRIDATSDAAFEKSFAKVARSLRGYEPRRFALGLFGVLLPRQCLSSEAVLHLTFSPVAPGDGLMLLSCREHLQGKSYVDIINDSNLKKGAP
jgi:hypothetical protein